MRHADFQSLEILEGRGSRTAPESVLAFVPWTAGTFEFKLVSIAVGWAPVR